MRANRTWLFVPADNPRRVGKALTLTADAVILDLEDAVAVSQKAAARAALAGALVQPRACRAYVRINALETDFAWGDLQAAVLPGLDGIVLPKAERAADILTADWAISALERDRGLAPGSIDLMPIIETARGLAAAREICAVGGRVRRVSFGAGDYTRDLCMEWTMAEHEIDAARAEIVLASRLAGLEAPVDTVFAHIREAEAFRASCARARQMGFQGKLLIHPDQIGPASAAFTPTAAEAAWARKVVAAFREAEAAGLASIRVEGQFVDYPIAARAERIVALADAIEGNDG